MGYELANQEFGDTAETHPHVRVRIRITDEEPLFGQTSGASELAERAYRTRDQIFFEGVVG